MAITLGVARPDLEPDTWPRPGPPGTDACFSPPNPASLAARPPFGSPLRRWDALQETVAELLRIPELVEEFERAEPDYVRVGELGAELVLTVLLVIGSVPIATRVIGQVRFLRSIGKLETRVTVLESEVGADSPLQQAIRSVRRQVGSLRAAGPDAAAADTSIETAVRALELIHSDIDAAFSIENIELMSSLHEALARDPAIDAEVILLDLQGFEADAQITESPEMLGASPEQRAADLARFYKSFTDGTRQGVRIESEAELAQAAETARGMCRIPDCGSISSKMLELGLGQRTIMLEPRVPYAERAAAFRDDLGSLREEWLYHVGLQLEDGRVVDPLLRVIYESEQAFVDAYIQDASLFGSPQYFGGR